MTAVEEVTDATSRASNELVDPAIIVQESAATPEVTTVWRISQNLTDRWGELNFYDSANKPHGALINDPELLERLTAQMCDEVTFVVRKDGQYGILFELEYCSIESEASDQYPADESLKPHARVVNALLVGIARLRERFPGVPMCVPDKAQIFSERPAIWAFVKDGSMATSERDALCKALMEI